MTQSCYLELLDFVHCQIPSNDLRTNLNESINYLLKCANEVTIGNDELTRILTRLTIHLGNVEIQSKLFIYIQQTRTELSFIETLRLEENLSLFESVIRQWLTDLFFNIDLFNEELYTKVFPRRKILFSLKNDDFRRVNYS